MRPPSPKPKPPEKPKGAKPPEKPKPVTKTASVGDVVIQEDKDDVEMPEGWVAMTDEGSGYQYFYNTKDGQTVWTWEEMEGGGTGDGWLGWDRLRGCGRDWRLSIGRTLGLGGGLRGGRWGGLRGGLRVGSPDNLAANLEGSLAAHRAGTAGEGR